MRDPACDVALCICVYRALVGEPCASARIAATLDFDPALYLHLTGASCFGSGFLIRIILGLTRTVRCGCSFFFRLCLRKPGAPRRFLLLFCNPSPCLFIYLPSTLFLAGPSRLFPLVLFKLTYPALYGLELRFKFERDHISAGIRGRLTHNSRLCLGRISDFDQSLVDFVETLGGAKAFGCLRLCLLRGSEALPVQFLHVLNVASFVRRELPLKSGEFFLKLTAVLRTKTTRKAEKAGDEQQDAEPRDERGQQ